MEATIIANLVLTGIGGLGIFLLGMKNMSDGMQAVAGNSLRRLIGAVTNNRLLATAVGAIVTCVVQSSSITTVMVVGFVNSGVMTLGQAIGVIMGANVGTTITGWILVLKIGKYGLPLLGASAFVYLFSRYDRWRYWAMSLMGLGMVFFGLELMKEACAQIEHLPEFSEWFQRFQADSYIGVLGCAFAGCLLTIMVQSSSATLGITISLAYEGLISYDTAAALVLGENIGTTVTAYLASLGATTNARRAAYFHVIFNLIGVFWITLIFPWYIDLIQWIVDGDVAQAVINNGSTVYPRTTAAIAATHSVFNIANTLLFMPFSVLIARGLIWMFPGKGFKEKPHLTDLDIRMLETPILGIEQSRREILKMGDGCVKMLGWLKTLMEQPDADPALAERLHQREKILDSVQDEIAAFMTTLLSGNVPHSVAEEARQQLRMADEYESVSDYIDSILKFHTKLTRGGNQFSDDERKQLAELHERVSNYLRLVNDAYRSQNRSILVQTRAISKEIRRLIKQIRREHLVALSAQQVAPEVNVAFLATLNSYSRVRDHSLNLAEVISGEK